jgi:membrane fusion protein, multidrug efflux system
MTRAALILTLLACTLLAAACGSKGSSAATQSAGATLTTVRVGTYRVGRKTFQRQVEFPATLLASKDVMLVSKVPGEIRKVFVAEGDRVKKGQTLIQLDQRDFALALRQAKAQLAAASAGLETARAGLDSIDTAHARVAALRKEKAVSQSNFDDVDGRRKVTAAQLKGAQAQLQLGQVAVDAAATNLSYTTIRAPFDGAIGKRMVDEGARVMPQAPLMTVLDASNVKVEGGVAEGDLPFVKKGSPASIIVDALGPTPIKGAVDRIEPTVDPRSRTATVRVMLQNTEGRLQPGMSARVVLDLGEAEAPAVPDDAILKSELGTSRGEVMIVSEGRAKRRELILGRRSGDVVEVRKGLQGGELIVRGGQEKLQDGQPVEAEGPGGRERHEGDRP